jgi:starch synthase
MGQDFWVAPWLAPPVSRRRLHPHLQRNGSRIAQAEAIPGKRIVVQPHGVPLAVYQQDCRPDARSAFPQIAGRQMLLCVGRIDPIKNQAWLLEQAPAIFQRHPKALLVLAGPCTDEPYGELMRRKIQELGLLTAFY